MSSDNEASNLIIGASISGLLLAAGHWFPWGRIQDQGLSRIGAYTYGTASILAGYAVTAALNKQPKAAAWLLLIDIFSGIIVVGAYKVDDRTRETAQGRRMARRARITNEYRAKQ